MLRVDPSSGARTILSDAVPSNEPPWLLSPGSPVVAAFRASRSVQSGQLVVVEVIERLIGNPAIQ